jgi:hypothetical protein
MSFNVVTGQICIQSLKKNSFIIASPLCQYRKKALGISSPSLLKTLVLSQDAPALTNGLRKCGIYTQWNFMQP